MREDKLTCESVQRAFGDSMAELTAAESEHLTVCDICTDALITRMLEQKPDIIIPADFARRVRSRLADSVIASKDYPRTPGYGFTTAMVLLMLLALVWGLFTYFDPHSSLLGGRLALVLEYVIVCEIGAIALWLGLAQTAGS